MGQWDEGWMDQERAKYAGIKAADEARDAALLGHMAAQRARQAGGSARPAEWTPKRDQLTDWISQAGIPGTLIPDAGTEPPPMATPGEYSQAAEDQFQKKAWQSLPRDVQDAGILLDGSPAAEEAAVAFRDAYDRVVAADKAEVAATLTANRGW